jgi:hypothetical protein
MDFFAIASAEDSDSFMAGRDLGVAAAAIQEPLCPLMKSTGCGIAAIVNVEGHNGTAQQGERDAVHPARRTGLHGGFEAAPRSRIFAAGVKGWLVAAIWYFCETAIIGPLSAPEQPAPLVGQRLETGGDDNRSGHRYIVDMLE